VSYCTAEIRVVVPERRGAPHSADDEWQSLHDLVVVSGMPVAHVVAIDQIDGAFLANLHQQMRVLAGLIRQQNNAAGVNIGVIVIQCLLIPGREIIGDRDTGAGPSQPENAVTVIDASGIDVKPPIARRRID
jgi:hypothetical protein